MYNAVNVGKIRSESHSHAGNRGSIPRGITTNNIKGLSLIWVTLILYQNSNTPQGTEERVVYLSKDAYQALLAHLKVRPSARTKRFFLASKGRYRGRPLNVRGIQHRMKYYSHKAGFKVTCHQLCHTMAAQMLNAEADLVTIQDLLGHAYIR